MVVVGQSSGVVLLGVGQDAVLGDRPDWQRLSRSMAIEIQHLGFQILGTPPRGNGQVFSPLQVTPRHGILALPRDGIM